jgi:hypothetical protein
VKQGIKKTPPRETYSFNPEAMAQLASSFFIGHVQERVGRGVDIDGKDFVRYSEGYALHLVEMGESTKVDMRLTGGMLNALGIIDKSKRGNVVSYVVGLKTGASRRVKAPKRGRARSARTRSFGGSWNVVGYAHQHGRKHLPMRRWFGITRKALKEMMDDMKAVALKKQMREDVVNHQVTS